MMEYYLSVGVTIRAKTSWPGLEEMECFFDGEEEVLVAVDQFYV